MGAGLDCVMARKGFAEITFGPKIGGKWFRGGHVSVCNIYYRIGSTKNRVRTIVDAQQMAPAVARPSS